MQANYEFTRLLVSDFRSAFLFYRDVMGFRVTFGSENDTYADFAAGAAHISLFDRSEMSAALVTQHLPTRAEAQDRVCLVFAVPDVDAACRELDRLGVILVVGPTDHADWGIRTAHFRDPDGNLIEINQPLTNEQ